MEIDLDPEIYKKRDPGGSHFKKVAIPAALIFVLVIVGEYGFRLRTSDVSLMDKIPNMPMSLMPVYWGGAAVLSSAMLLLAWGLYQDRKLVPSQDDRLAGEYIAAASVFAITCAFCAAVPGVLIGAAIVIAVVNLRRKSIHLRGPAARDAGNAVYLALAASLLRIGAVEPYNMYFNWTEGFRVSQIQRDAFRSAHGGDIVYWTVAVFALATIVLLPIALWYHRWHLNDPPKPARTYCYGASAALLLAAWMPNFRDDKATWVTLACICVAFFSFLETYVLARTYRNRRPALQN